MPRPKAAGARYILSLDVGTSNVKALLLGPTGRSWVASEPCPVRFGPGRAEVVPAGWWQATCRAISSALAQAELEARQVAQVTLTGNMSSVVLLDPRGRPVRPAILIADGRGDQELEELPQRLRRRIASVTGNPLSTSFTLGKLLWLGVHEPARLAAARVWCAAKDYIRYRLTATVGSDPSDAYNSLLLDPATLGWDRSLIEDLGLPVEIFPPVAPGNELAGSLTAAAARATGLAVGTPVLVGVGDMAALAIGVGWLERPRVVVSLGTSTTILVPFLSARPGDNNAAGFSVHPILPGSPWLLLGSLLTGGLALDWLRRLGAVPAGALSGPADDDLVFLPQLSGRGSPCFAPQWRGTLIGINPSTGTAEIARALFRAVAFEIRLCLETLGVKATEPIVLTGGGSAIEAWNQALADGSGAAVRPLRAPEATAFGAALLTTGDRGSALLRRALSGRVVEPRADPGAVDHAYRHYLEAREIAASFYDRSAHGRSK